MLLPYSASSLTCLSVRQNLDESSFDTFFSEFPNFDLTSFTFFEPSFLSIIVILGLKTMNSSGVTIP